MKAGFAIVSAHQHGCGTELLLELDDRILHHAVVLVHNLAALASKGVCHAAHELCDSKLSVTSRIGLLSKC